MHPMTIMKFAQRTIVDVVEGLPDEAWDMPGVCGVWSVKQIIGHLVAWEHYQYEFLSRAGQHAIETPYMDALDALGEDGFNDRYGTQASGRSPAELMTEFDAVYHKINAVTAGFSNELWHQQGITPWPSKDSDLEDYVVAAQYGHKHEHASQIRVFRDRVSSMKG